MGEAKRRKQLLKEKYGKPTALDFWNDLTTLAIMPRNKKMKLQVRQSTYLLFAKSLVESKPGFVVQQFSKINKARAIAEIDSRIKDFETKAPTTIRMAFFAFEENLQDTFLSDSSISVINSLKTGRNQVPAQAIKYQQDNLNRTFDFKTDRMFLQQFDFPEGSELRDNNNNIISEMGIVLPLKQIKEDLKRFDTTGFDYGNMIGYID